MRKILVTGATAGFGKLIVEAFLENGDTVIATGRNLINRQEIFEKERRIYGDKIIEISLDISDKSEIESAFKIVQERCGHINILINNAGYGSFGALEDTDDKEIRYQMEVNFFGTINMTKTFLPMLRQTRGMIFNVSSVFGFMGWPLTSLYSASKYAVEGFTESLRGELAPHGVQVCLIEPGGYRTNFGTSLAWNNKPDSAYSLQFENYQKLRTQLAGRKPQLPQEVSQGILKLSRKNKLPMRKVFGKDGRTSYYLKHLLPSCLYYPLMDLVHKRVFMRERG